MFIWIDANDFTNRGQWKLDTQFTHLIGSPCLLACHTPGVPVEDASCSVEIPLNGMVRVWARTKNWYLPDAPGRFSALLDGKEGPELGTMPTHDWYWQIAGDFAVKPGRHEVTLHDRTGYFGRCAALLITDDMDFVPPRPASASTARPPGRSTRARAASRRKSSARSSTSGKPGKPSLRICAPRNRI